MAIQVKHIVSGLVFSTLWITAQSASAFQGEQAEEIWRPVRVKTTRTVPVEKTRLVTETAYETKQVPTSKPVWETETRQRRVETMKPVPVTPQRTEQRTVYKPVEVTRYRERQVEETEYREVTRYRDETYTVEVPVTETRMRGDSLGGR